MSGILKKVGKVFKKVVKSKIFKIAAIAAAVYFTGGIAAGAMGSSFAAGLPGIQSAASMLGVTSGAFGAAGAGAAAEAAAGIAGGFGSVDASMAFGGAAETAGASAAGGGGLINTARNVQSGVSLAKNAFGGGISTSATSPESGYMGGVKTPAESFKATTPDLKKDSSWYDDLFTNPNVAKAALTFGSDALKTGVGLYAQKVAADDKEEAEREAKADYWRTKAVPSVGPAFVGPQYAGPPVVNAATGG